MVKRPVRHARRQYEGGRDLPLQVADDARREAASSESAGESKLEAAHACTDGEDADGT